MILFEISEEIKMKYKDLILCIDNMFVNNMPIFTSINKFLHFRALVPLENRQADELF